MAQGPGPRAGGLAPAVPLAGKLLAAQRKQARWASLPLTAGQSHGRFSLGSGPGGPSAPVAQASLRLFSSSAFPVRGGGLGEGPRARFPCLLDPYFPSVLISLPFILNLVSLWRRARSQPSSRGYVGARPPEARSRTPRGLQAVGGAAARGGLGAHARGDDGPRGRRRDGPRRRGCVRRSWTHTEEGNACLRDDAPDKERAQ